MTEKQGEKGIIIVIALLKNSIYFYKNVELYKKIYCFYKFSKDKINKTDF